MTQGEFFLVLAKLAEEYQRKNHVLHTTIPTHANACGLSIDEEGPHSEQAEILKPLEVFLNGAVQKIDMLWQYAHMHLVWEAYQSYIDHKHTRIRARTLAEQSSRRHAHRS